MSEHIVHTGILEDSMALIPLLDLPPDFKNALLQHIPFAKLGCITVAGDTFSFRLLEEFKPLWKNKDDLLEAKLAFVIGWVSHRACDRVMKPIWNVIEISGRGSDANPAVSPTECSVYHEAELYNRYYAEDAIFCSALFQEKLAAYPCAEWIDLDYTQSFVESSFSMNLISIQTLEGKQGQSFIEELCLRAQKFYVDVGRYTQAAGNPEPEKRKKFVLDINWYDEKDEILALALALRCGTPLIHAESTVRRAIEKPAKSHYGRALQLSLNYITAAAKYLNDPDMSQDELQRRLDIGKMGPGGIPV